LVARERFELRFSPKDKNQTYQVLRQTKVCGLGEKKWGFQEMLPLRFIRKAKTLEDFIAITSVS
jgi:hypothetical protein